MKKPSEKSVSNLQNIDLFWRDIFSSNDTVSRTYFFSLPQITRLKSHFLFRILFKDSSLTKFGILVGFFLKGIAVLTLNRFVPFRVLNDRLEFSQVFLKFKRLYTNMIGPPRYFSGGLILNLLGYQVIRTLYYHIRISLRLQRVNNRYLPTKLELEVHKNGYGILENVLSNDALIGLNRLLDSPQLLSSFKRDNHPCGWTKKVLHAGGSNVWGSHDEALNIYVDEILSNHYFFEVVERLSGRKIEVTPEISIFEWKPEADSIGLAHQFDFEDMFHADVSYPTFKAFLYLNDVNRENGAFSYCPNTHRFGIKRLVFEYFLSLAYYFSNKKYFNEPQPHRFTNWLVNKFNIKSIPIEGPANTMILANVMGFHKRERFFRNAPRRLLFLNFRYLDRGVIY
jgi:hypothetical protein